MSSKGWLFLVAGLCVPPLAGAVYCGLLYLMVFYPQMLLTVIGVVWGALVLFCLIRALWAALVAEQERAWAELAEEEASRDVK